MVPIRYHRLIGIVVMAVCVVLGVAACSTTSPGAQAPDTQYILVNFTDPSEAAFQEVARTIGEQKNPAVKVGVGVIVSYLSYPPEEAAARLRRYLSYAEQYDLPIIVQIDGEQWLENRPDLWNWWDPDRPGFNPENRHNVEWTSWDPADAVKIGWRDWGRQLRVLPMPNLMSPAYREACRAEMEKLVPIVVDWYAGLPEEKRYLFVGVKVGWESSIGVNNWYYPDGNDLLDRPEKDDPKFGKTIDDLPSRGVTAMGYAAVTTLGLANGGELTEEHLTEVVRVHLEDLSRTCAQLGVPRDHLFTHSGGWSQGESLYTAALNEYASPGWSFYDFAGNPSLDTTAMNALAMSDAPYWGAVEWLYNGKHADDWHTAITQTLSLPAIKYLCIYNWEGIRADEQSVNAIKQFMGQ